MTTTAVRAKFARALIAVQPVHKTQTAKVSDTFTYRYATLGNTLQSVKDACQSEGLAIAQTINEHGDRMQIMTEVIDTESGESLSFGGPVIPVKGEPQAMGSALSYIRRYALTTLFALNVEDDDGAQAQRQAATPQNRTEAESQIRELLGHVDKPTRQAFAGAFKETFHSTLTELEESRHGDALAWSKGWLDLEMTHD